MKTTEALILPRPGTVELGEMSLASVGPEDVLIRVTVGGICMFDVGTFRGTLKLPFPRYAGHEGAGVIEEVGERVDTVHPGDLVTFNSSPCFARYHVAKATNVARVAPGTTDLALWISEPCACSTNGVRSARIEPGDDVVLIGAGYMGLLLVQGLPKEIMRHFVVVDVDDRRLQLARAFGAEIVINSTHQDALREVQRLTSTRDATLPKAERAALAKLLDRPESELEQITLDLSQEGYERLGSAEGRVHDNFTAAELSLAEHALHRVDCGADVVIEAAGAPGTLDLASRMLRTGGRLSIFAFHTKREEVPTPLWHMAGLEVQNPAPGFSRNWHEDWRDAVRLLHKGVYRQAELITHRFPHTDAQHALEYLAGRPEECIKAVFTFD